MKLTHMGLDVDELHADIGVELAFGDLVEQLVIELRALLGFVGVSDVFAEVVHADSLSALVDRFGGGKHIFNSHAGDEPAREAFADGRLLRHRADGFALRQPDEKGSQQTNFCTTRKAERYMTEVTGY